MRWEFILLIILAALALVVFLYIIGTINNFRKMLVKIDESESSIDVAITKRFDVLNKMFSAVKGYMKHETETLEEIVKLRMPKHESPLKDKEGFANELSKGLETISLYVEQYPDLKSNTNVLKLQEAAIEVEENLQAARRVYNSNVSIYNQKVVIFPSNIIANYKKFTKREFFEAEAVKREDPKLEF